MVLGTYLINAMQAVVAVVAADMLHLVICKPAIHRMYRDAQLRQSLVISQEVTSLEVINDKTADRPKGTGRTGLNLHTGCACCMGKPQYYTRWYLSHDGCVE